MPSGTLQVTGDTAVVQRLLGLASKGKIKRVMNRALGAGTNVIKAEAKSLIAARTRRRSGRLRKGVEVTRIATTRQGNWTRRVQTKRREFFDIDPSDKFYYPAVVEAGHDTADAKRFMRDAHRTKGKAAATAMETEIAAGIEREAAK